MNEFTVEVTTPVGREVSDDELVAVHEQLIAKPAALGPAVGANLEKNTVSATFQVEAGDVRAALELAVNLFAEALEAAGLRGHEGPSHVAADREELVLA